MLQRARAEARAQGDPAGEARALASLVRVLFELGRFDAAEGQLKALSALLPAREQPGLTLLAAHGAAARGKWAEAERIFVQYMRSSGSPRVGAAAFRYPGTVTQAATAGLGAGDAAAADTLAQQALRLAREEGDDEARSAVIGDALAIQARARLAQGDSSAARGLLERALVPLGNGYGSGHVRTTAARALLDSLSRR
jgi:tetratricopeptide (TPR) repeat protein